MKTYYIFRHGDTFATKTGEDYGDQILTAPILPESKTYLEKIGLYLSAVVNPYCLSSDVLRCIQTANIVSNVMKHKFLIDKRLTEYHIETFDDFINRMEEFVEAMELNPHKNIVLCTHGGCIGGIKHLLLDNEITEDDVIDYPMPGILIIISGGKMQEIDFRVGSH